MKREGLKSRSNTFVVALAAISLAGCAMEMEGEEQLWSEQDELTAEERATEEVADAEAPEIAGSCSTGTENGGHTAVGTCSGYMDTGTFKVTTMCCLTSCFGPIGGGWAYKAGGTSKAGCGSAYASNVQIVFGPVGG